MKIVKYDIFRPVKDTLGFGQLCAVMGVTFGQRQCDCSYQEIIILMDCVIYSKLVKDTLF